MLFPGFDSAVYREKADPGLCLTTPSRPLAELTWLGGKALDPGDSCDSGSEEAKRLRCKLAVVPKEIWELLGALLSSVALSERVRCKDWSELSWLSAMVLLLLLGGDDCDAVAGLLCSWYGIPGLPLSVRLCMLLRCVFRGVMK